MVESTVLDILQCCLAGQVERFSVRISMKVLQVIAMIISWSLLAVYGQGKSASYVSTVNRLHCMLTLDTGYHYVSVVFNACTNQCVMLMQSYKNHQ